MNNNITKEKRKRASYARTIQNRDIKELIHFTRIENVPSIFQHGILSRERLKQKGINAFINDQERFDEYLDASCVSVSFPNWRLFYTFRMQQKQTIWAVLSLDPKLLLDMNIREMYFFADNAAGKETARCAFEEMFGESDEAYPSNEQAEVLVFGDIPTKYIRKVYVKYIDDVMFLCEAGISMDKIQIAPRYFRQPDKRKGLK